LNKEALRFKKAQGMKLGRPTGPGKSNFDPYRPEIESLLENGSTQNFIARRYHTTEANLHNWLPKHGLKLSTHLGAPTSWCTSIAVPETNPFTFKGAFYNRSLLVF
jgi:hypothetical protein